MHTSPSYLQAVRSDGVVYLRGELDGASASAVTDVLRLACAEHPVVLLDLAGVSFADTSGLTPLINAVRSGCVEFGAVSPAVSHIFALLGIGSQPLDLDAWDRVEVPENFLAAAV